MASTANPFPIFDGHNDTLLSIYLPEPGEERAFFKRSKHGHIDYPRAKKGGFGGGFFAIYTPPKKRASKAAPKRRKRAVSKIDPNVPFAPPPVKHEWAQQFTLGMAALLFRVEKESNGKFKIVRTADELEKCLKKGVMAAIFHIEGAEAIDNDLNMLEVLYQSGLRSIGPVWSRPNAFGYGVPFQHHHSPDTGPGLTDAGKALVRACNELGVMIDLSHLNEKGFWDVQKLSNAPLVATHSCVHALSPATRNLTDKQLDAIKESDGMVGLNFAVSFLREDGKNDADMPLETMVRHIDYLVERIGLGRVGLGSDFDGATIAADIKDVSGLPNLIAALRKAGYDDDSLRKITHENWLRVLRKTWGK
jgi:membrane dipeptidase